MNLQTLLHRQVNPSFVQANRVTSQVFRPTPKDDNLLSVSDGDQITAERAYQRFVCTSLGKSIGVLSVSVEECRSLDVQPIPDPIEEKGDQLEQLDHCVIDFRNKSGRQIEKIASQLRDGAVIRGWSYGPVNGS